MTKVTQGAFNAGVLSEGMYARSDTEKYQKGLRAAVNVLVQPQGGVANRAGFEAVTRFDPRGAEKQFLIPFEFNTEQTYQLEFCDDVFRVIKQGEYVLDSAVGARPLVEVTTAAQAWLVLDTIANAQAFTVGDIVYVNDPNGDHAAHQMYAEITERSNARLFFTVYDGGRLNTLSAGWGTLGAGATIQKVYAKTHTLSDFANLRFAQDADTLYVAHRDYPPSKIGRLADDDWLFQDVDFGAGIDPVSNGSVTVTPTLGADVDLTRLVTYSYAVSAIDGDNFEESVPTATVDADNDMFYQGSYNDIAWSAVAGATRYALYRKSAGSLAYIGTTSELTFRDENITPDEARGPQIARNPFSAPGDYPAVVSFYEQRLAYGATINDPQLIEMSRIGNVENFSGAFPSLPDDAFRFRIRDSRVNAVRAFVPRSSFVILTSGGEWEIAAQGDGEYIRPDKRKLNPFSNYGSAALQPLFTGTVVLFLEPSENVVREYRPGDPGTPPQDLTIIGADLVENKRIVSWAYAAAPNKVVWAVLDDGSVVTMTYMPEHDVWGWTEQDIGGDDVFVRQVSVIKEGTRDVPYIVVSRTLNGVEVTLTERQRKREDLDVRKGYFVDGGVHLTYAEPTSSVSGLLHLRGQTVVALLDGDVFNELTVDETGSVDFGERSVTNVSIGLSYVAFIQTLDLRMDVQGLGSSEGRYKSTSEGAIKLKRSRGVEVGIALNKMYGIQEWDASLVGGPIPLRTHTPNFTFDGDWEIDATVFVRQRHPLPMTVLAISPDWEMGE